MSPRSKINFGVLGVARIVERLAPALRSAPDLQLLAVASRSLPKARAAARKWNAARAYRGYDQLLRDDDLHAVYIPLPNHLHCDWTIRALEHGKHVLCEKPLAINAGEARRMRDAALANDRLLMEAFMYRHHPQIARVRKLISDDAIGEVRTVFASFGGVFGSRKADYRNLRAFGGGAFYDLGCYCVNIARLLFDDEPFSASAGASLSEKEAIDIHFAGSLSFPRRRLFSFLCSFAAALGQKVIIAGDRGRIEIPSAFTPGDAVTSLCVTTGARSRTVRVKPADSYLLELRHFVKSIRCGRLLAPAEDGLANMIAMEALMRAASLVPVA